MQNNFNIDLSHFVTSFLLILQPAEVLVVYVPIQVEQTGLQVRDDTGATAQNVAFLCGTEPMNDPSHARCKTAAHKSQNSPAQSFGHMPCY
jgi:hypothetical protein